MERTQNTQNTQNTQKIMAQGIPALMVALVVATALMAASIATAAMAMTASPPPAETAPATDANLSEGERAWPVAGAAGVDRGRPVVVRGWEPPASPWGPGHRGVDLKADPGQPVRAATPGVVSFAGTVAGRGVVSVELSGTAEAGDSRAPPLRTTYEPVRATVRAGDRVRAGDALGTLQDGFFHCREGCLHWGLLRGGRYLDPLSLLPVQMRRSGHARLLPVSGVPPPAAGDGRRVSWGTPHGAPWPPRLP
jgi:murein DD-endopeptidase MepM/ murein hydrolase activator NlpD